MWALVNGLLDVLCEILCAFLNYFSGEFWGQFQIPEVNLLDGEMFSPDYQSGHGQTFLVSKTAFFDQWFGGMKSIRYVFKGMGMLFATVFATFGLLKSMVPDFISGEKPDHPSAIIIRFGITSIMVGGAYQILAIIQTPMAKICHEIYNLPYGKKGAYGLSHKAEFSTWSNIKAYFTSFGTENNSPVKTAANGLSKGATNGFGTNGGADPLTDALTLVLAIFCIALLGWLFMKLVIEMIERYVTMGLLFYCAPIAFGFYSTTSTAQVTKKYMQMMLSQYVLLMFNFIFLYVFLGAFSNLDTVMGSSGGTSSSGEGLFACIASAAKSSSGTSGTGEANSINVVIYCFALAAWLRLGARIDELIQSLGISAARTGAGLGMELAGAAGATITAARMATKLGGKMMPGKGAPGKAGKGAASGASTGPIKRDNNGKAIGGEATPGIRDNKNHNLGPSHDDIGMRNDFENNFGGSDGFGKDGARNITDQMQKGSLTRTQDGAYHATSMEGNAVDMYPEGNANYDPNGIGAHVTGKDGQRYFMPQTTDNRNDAIMHEAMGSNKMTDNANNSKNYSEATPGANPGTVHAVKTINNGDGTITKQPVMQYSDNALSVSQRQAYMKAGAYRVRGLNNVLEIEHGDPVTVEKTKKKS